MSNQTEISESGLLVNEKGSFDRTLSECSKALKDAGFVIKEIVEPKPIIEVIQQNPRILAFDANRFTLFIIFDFIKM